MTRAGAVGLCGLGLALLGAWLPAQSASGESLELSLAEAISRAVAQSNELKALAVQQEDARISWESGIRAFLPSVDLKFSKMDTIVDNGPDSRNLNLGLSLSQLVFDGNRSGRSRSLAGLELEKTERTRQAAIQSMGDKIESLARRREMIRLKREIQEKTISIARDQAAITRREFELGSALELDALETELGVQSLEAQRGQMDLEAAQVDFMLHAILNIPAEQDVRVMVALSPGYAGLRLPAQWPALVRLAELNSTQLGEQELAIRSQSLELVSQEQWYLPTVRLEASMAFSAERLPWSNPQLEARLVLEFPLEAMPFEQSLALGSPGAQQRTNAWSSKLGILDDLAWLDKMGTARARLAVARQQREQTRRELGFAIAQQLATHGLKIQQLEQSRAAIATSERRIAILSKRLSLGELRRIEYLQAETKLAQDRINLLETVFGLMELERGIEQVAGLEPGRLAALLKEQS